MNPENSASPHAAALDWPHQDALWIWTPESSPNGTNERFTFEKTATIERVDLDWTLEIAVDSRYRLRINDRWVCDGPARSYPDALFFDRVPIASFLRPGTNHFSVEVTHFGVDTFQYIRGHAGLLLAVFSGNEPATLVSDLSWQVRRVAGHCLNTPRISSQLGFEEHLDLTLPELPAQAATLSERQTGKFTLTPRDVGLLGREERQFQRVVGRSTIKEMPRQWTIHLREHLGTFPNSSNVHGMAGLYGVELHAAEDDDIEICVLGPIYQLHLDGVRVKPTTDQDLLTFPLSLKAGVHWLTISYCDRYDHVYELAVGARSGTKTEFRSPLGGESANPWVTTGPLWKAIQDTNCPLSSEGTIDPDVDTFSRDDARMKALIGNLAACKTAKLFSHAAPAGMLPLPAQYLTELDAYFSVRADEEISSNPVTEPFSTEPLEMISGQRVILDMEDITNGYLQFTVESEALSVIDGCFFEHLESTAGSPKIQYLQNDGLSYRSSFRLTAPAGRHFFLSAQRRGFRYCMLTLRKASKPVRIHGLSAIESIYEPSAHAAFQCSDERLNAIFRISQRTLLLCMEDTYTDCPSYEQAMWVGDARYEMLFANMTFGAYDLSERCSRLVAKSLQTLPLPACQCPSAWDILIPSFSFLWIISVWETYFQSGRKAFLQETYPAVKKSLDTALKYCTDQGLYSSPTANFLDWAPIDSNHSTVTHNSILLTGALQAGAKIADLLDNAAQAKSYRHAATQLTDAVNRLWNSEAKCYPDSIDGTGKISEKNSQHTSMLALQFDMIADPVQRKFALENCLSPRHDTTKVGSPGAMFLLLEVLFKEGHPDFVLERLRSFWLQMLKTNSPTFWEMINPPEAPFPTRSYCHGWSAAPVYLLPYLLFGIEVLEPGWAKVRLRPRNLGLTFAETTICTPHGMLVLRQKTSEEGQLTWSYEAPQGVTVVGG